MAFAGQIVSGPFNVARQCSVKLVVRSDQPVKPGDTIEVQFANSWLMISGPSFTRKVQTDDPAGEHYVSFAAERSAARFEVAVSKRNLFFPDGEARHGRLFAARLTGGEVPAGEPITCTYANTVAPYVAGREAVHVRLNGQPPIEPPITEVLPGPAVSMRIIVPSCVRPGQKFDVLLVSLDQFENCSASKYEGMALSLMDGHAVAENLSFAGSVRVPVTLDQEGVFRFRAGEAVSNAVRVAATGPRQFWGDMHIHSNCSSDAMGSDPYGYARDVSGLDFACTADHCESLGQAGYEQTLAWVREANRPGVFAAMLGDERNPKTWTGHHNVYFRDEQTFLRCRVRPGCSPNTDQAESAEAVVPMLEQPSGCMLVPHHTGIAWGALPKAGLGSAVDIDAVADDRGLRPIMEIYSHHGQSEVFDPHHILAYEFNRMRNPEKRSNVSMPGPHYAQDYWAAGRRLGVIGSSDEHSGQGGRRHGGLAAVFADELIREAVFDSLQARRCYATTGERVLVEFSVDGVAMGQEARRPRGSKLPIRLAVWGTAPLIRVEVLRFRFGVDDRFMRIESITPRVLPAGSRGGHVVEGLPQMTLDATVELTDELAGPAVYYARVVQEPLDWPGMAWTSPVWITVE